MKFISNNNLYELEGIDWKNNLISLYIFNHIKDDAQYVTFEWEGDIKFFRDSNGVGESWIDYETDITLSIVPELSDTNLVLLNLNNEYIIEHIAEELYKLQESEI